MPFLFLPACLCVFVSFKPIGNNFINTFHKFLIDWGRKGGGREEDIRDDVRGKQWNEIISLKRDSVCSIQSIKR